MKTGKELTAKQKLFVENYVSNGYKLQKAYMDAYPDAQANTANAMAWKLMKDERIKAYIKEYQHERVEALNITADRIAAELEKMAFAEIDKNNTPSTKARALELLQKQMGLDKQIIEAKVETTNITVDIEDEDE